MRNKLWTIGIFTILNFEFINMVCLYLFLLQYFQTYQQAPLRAQTVKNLPAIQDTRVQYLSREDPLEKGMATHSSILACRIPWTENSLEGYSPRGHKGLDMPEQLTLDIGLYSCDPCVIKIVQNFNLAEKYVRFGVVHFGSETNLFYLEMSFHHFLSYFYTPRNMPGTESTKMKKSHCPKV